MVGRPPRSPESIKEELQEVYATIKALYRRKTSLWNMLWKKIWYAEVKKLKRQYKK